MTCIAYALLGAFFGAAVTVLVWALCATASATDRHMEQEEGKRMTHSDEHIARLEAQADAAATERRQLRAIIAELRGVLGTPENASVVQHARDVVAEAQACREDLAQALHDAEKWRAVPWDAIASAMLGWELHGDIDDAMTDIVAWYDNSKPEEVTAE